MKVTLVNYTQNAARILILAKSTRLNLNADLIGNIANMSDDEILKELDYIANTIPSAWEFIRYTFLVEGVSRNCTHQMVRTRTGSYAEQSMRVTNQCEFEFIMPEAMKGASCYAVAKTETTLDKIKDCYSETILEGFAPEDARSILPGNISTNILCCYNLRTFSDLVKSRTGGRTQGEYQRVANAMADAVLAVHPWADKFLFNKERNYFDEIEEFAKAKFTDLRERGELLKIVDKMRKDK